MLKSVKSGSFSIQSLSFNSSLYPSSFTFNVALFTQLAGSSFLCRRRRETGRPEEGKRKRAGDGGNSRRGKRGSCFSIIAMFIGIPSGSLPGGEREGSHDPLRLLKSLKV